MTRPAFYTTLALVAAFVCGNASAARAPERQAIPAVIHGQFPAPKWMATLLAAKRSTSAVRSGPEYVTAARVMAAFQENGIKISGAKRTVLDAACEGVGYSRGAFPYQRFHIFECYITAGGRQLAEYRVTTTTAGRVGQFYYQYQPVS